MVFGRAGCGQGCGSLQTDSGRVNTLLYHVRGNKEIGQGRAVNRLIMGYCAALRLVGCGESGGIAPYLT